MTVIQKRGYTIHIHGPDHATVEGGVLGGLVHVRRLLGDGDANPKTEKNLVPTVGLSLHPHKGAGFGNLCQYAKTCIKSCLDEAGRGGTDEVSNARIAKSVMYLLARPWFIAKLNRELGKFANAYDDLVIGARLNMFSDVAWERHPVIEEHPGITFYDYTKDPNRWGWVRPNYWVTFSYDGTNGHEARRILLRGGNVSVVFYHDTDEAVCGKAAHRQPLPARWRGFRVIDGGKTDWRVDDPRGVIVGLRLLAKDYTRRDMGIESGFAQKFDLSLPILA